MGLNAVKMLGISITTSSQKEILEEVRKYLSSNLKSQISMTKKYGKPLVIVTPNPEQVVLAQKDKHFAQILNQADVAIPDGIGVIWASRLLASMRQRVNASAIQQTIPGVEFMEDLVELAAKQRYPIALIGGRGGVAVEALECLRQKYPGLTGWALEPEELSLGHLGDLGNLGEKIKKINTRLLFVGLGAPKQEYVIARLAREFSIFNFQFPIVLMSVGGAFDIIAGRLKRAPLPIRNLGLEWLWRLCREPWRWRRQLALLQFIFLVLRERLRV